MGGRGPKGVPTRGSVGSLPNGRQCGTGHGEGLKVWDKVIMKTEWGLLISALVLGLGCAHVPPHSAGSPPSQSVEDHFVIHGQGGFTEAKVTDVSILGPAIDLVRTSRELRGRAYNQAVDITVDGSSQQARGIIGQQPLQLNVNTQGNEVHARGLVAGHLSDFTVGPAAINGKIGPCGYELVWTGSSYEGTRSCDNRTTEQLELRLPRAISFWEPAQAMASLSVFLLGKG